jgi:predicted CoA-binding protein
MSHSPAKAPSPEELRRIYAKPKTIAVVGASDTPGKPSHDIPLYLKSQGYRIVPVNPRGGEILGEKAFASLREVDAPIDIVEVFRPPEEAETVARAAVAAGAKVLWFQPDTESDEAVRALADEDIVVITGRCMGVTHGLLGLGPGPHRPGGG